jgi:multidrug transporter EmrE-like cation transporter
MDSIAGESNRFLLQAFHTFPIVAMSRDLALLLTFVIVLMISGGQLLFKIVASRAAARPDATLMEQWLTWPFFAALVVYGAATILWIWVLRHVELNVAYPIYALAFVFVPLATYFLFNEPLGWRHLIGGALIVAGVVVISRG